MYENDLERRSTQEKNYLPTRLLIKYVGSLKAEEIRKIDPSFKKVIVRIPLFLYPWATGLLSSISTSFIKGTSELVNSKEFTENI
jgi:hypothetical protein